MTTTPDEFESERSRAAVAVACLEWLRCTGPAIPPSAGRVTPNEVARLLRDLPSKQGPVLDVDRGLESPHPLWDRWIDG